MSKYDKMLELNKRKSEEKVERAVLTIRTMVLEREKVSVPALMQKTGLSRGFFYKNPIVRGEIDAAMEQQAGMVDPTASSPYSKALLAASILIIPPSTDGLLDSNSFISSIISSTYRRETSNLSLS